MHNLSITLDDDLFRALDTRARTLHLSVSAFIRHTLQTTMQRQQMTTLEAQHRQGYLKYPVTPGEFSDWEDEQVWGDA